MAVEHLSKDLQRIAAWCCTHSLLINPEKATLSYCFLEPLRALELSYSAKRYYCPVLQKIWGSSPVASHLIFDEHVTEVLLSV